MSSHRFDQQKAAEFLTAVKAGVPDWVAAAHAEIETDTIKAWLKGETKAARQFADDVLKERADLAILAIGSVRRTMSDDRGSARWMAEFLYGDAELKRLRELTT